MRTVGNYAVIMLKPAAVICIEGRITAAVATSVAHFKMEAFLLQVLSARSMCTLALFGALASPFASAEEIKTVFVIAMENHNWTQPANQFTGGIQQIYLNPAAPFLNSLVGGTGFVILKGKE